MRATFDVLERGWIPVVCGDGSRRLLGIRDTLAQAHTLREISDPSPLEEYSVYRFLGLFLMDALRPQKKSSIRSLLQEGRFDMERIVSYIALCRSEGVSFDLFDEKRPFLQSEYDSGLDGKEKPVAVLDCTMPSGNNHTHFIHTPPKTLSAEQAIRKMLVSSLHGDQVIRMTLYGVETRKASYLSVQRHDLVLPLSLAEDDRLELLKACVFASNQLRRALRKALEKIEAVPTQTRSIAEQKLENASESRFWTLCRQADQKNTDLKRLYEDYVSDVGRELWRIYDEALSTQRLRAHAMAVAEESRKGLYFEILKLKKEAQI